MTDDKNQDMEVEDILASIKSILEEDQAMTKESEPQIDSSDEVDIDDILDLSPDMRLVPEAENTDINLSDELDDIEEPQLPNEVSSADDTAISDVANTSFNISLGREDYESDPFYEEETKNINSIETYDLPARSEEEEKEEVEPMTIPGPQEEVEPVIALELEEKPQPVTVPEPQEEAESEKEDASVDIINNFAKMFAQEEAPKVEPVAAPVSETIKILGDGSKTIEDVVSSVIKQIIGEEVATNWKNGLDYDVLARQEIQRQTKEWLDNNLPSVVEKIVKQEIERVMAKVGTGQ